ncbi:hypothetical protein MNBD_GAMMA08-2088 [hydrothermal vent metagenome]|uniref:Integrating conjugative element protein n=1 Tax=hydrothermal vent metagenome TaxID=652676 RepID=A0A3B0YGF5_9ZZZZ
MKAIKCTILYTVMLNMFIVPPVQSAETAEKAPLMSTSIGDLYYQLGGGKVLPPPGANYTTFRIDARFKGGFGYSCGKFNYRDNISQMVNQIKSQARQLPGQLVLALQAAGAGLPGYFMQKKNPTLYNIITKTLDQSAELFKLSYKTCEAMESEMAKNPDANPYAGFLRASVASKWKIGTDNNEIAADIHQGIKDNPGAPITWIGGKKYGSTNNPIQINKDIVTAGYNIMIGRTGDVSVLTSPTDTVTKKMPIVRIWANPDLAGRWIQDVIGDKQVVLGEDAGVPKSIVGHGLRPKVLALEIDIYDAINTAILGDFSRINTYNSTLLSNNLIVALKQMPAGERAIMVDRMSSEMAAAEAQERLFLLKQMILTGLKSPDISASPGGVTADKYIRESTFPDINEALTDMHNDLDLKQRTINRTALLILGRASKRNRLAAGVRPGTILTDDGAIKGAVFSTEPEITQ